MSGQRYALISAPSIEQDEAFVVMLTACIVACTVAVVVSCGKRRKFLSDYSALFAMAILMSPRGFVLSPVFGVILSLDRLIIRWFVYFVFCGHIDGRNVSRNKDGSSVAMSAEVVSLRCTQSMVIINNL